MICRKRYFTSFFTGVLVLISLIVNAQQNPLEIRHLTGDFYIYTTYNLYKGTRIPANGMFVLTSAGAVLFDTPWDTTQTMPLLDYIRAKHHMEVILCVSTHSHDDRTGGLDQLNRKGIPTYTTTMTDSISALKGNPRAAHLFRNDTTFNVGAYRFSAIYPGPGHALDNIVLWFPAARVLYGGCFIKSTESIDLGYLGDANVPQWETSVYKVQALCKEPRYVIPGHGSWKNKHSLEHTLKLVRAYEKDAK